MKHIPTPAAYKVKLIDPVNCRSAIEWASLEAASMDAHAKLMRQIGQERADNICTRRAEMLRELIRMAA